MYLLWDAETAHLKSILVGEITEKRVGFSSVMALRTAATTGVGIRHLARRDSKVVGVYGTGGQALHKVLQQPFGMPMLIAMGLGIGCYGLFCFAWARHLDR